VFAVDGADDVVEFIVAGFETGAKIEVVFEEGRFVVFSFIIAG